MLASVAYSRGAVCFRYWFLVIFLPSVIAAEPCAVLLCSVVSYLLIIDDLGLMMTPSPLQIEYLTSKSGLLHLRGFTMVVSRPA